MVQRKRKKNLLERKSANLPLNEVLPLMKKQRFGVPKIRKLREILFYILTQKPGSSAIFVLMILKQKWPMSLETIGAPIV